MATYGLRVGAIPTIEIKNGYFAYTTKGNKSYTQELKNETLTLLKRYGKSGRSLLGIIE